MKQHLYAIITMVSLGTVGLVLSQPSFFKSDSETKKGKPTHKELSQTPAETQRSSQVPPSFDEFIEAKEQEPPGLEEVPETIRNLPIPEQSEPTPMISDQFSQTPPNFPPLENPEFDGFGEIPPFEESFDEFAQSEPESDLNFEDLAAPSFPVTSLPGVASTIPETSSMPEEDFSIFNQSLLDESEPGFAEIFPPNTAPTNEPKEPQEPQESATNLAVLPIVVPITKSGGGSAVQQATGPVPDQPAIIGSSYTAPGSPVSQGQAMPQFGEFDSPATDLPPLDFPLLGDQGQDAFTNESVLYDSAAFPPAEQFPPVEQSFPDPRNFSDPYSQANGPVPQHPSQPYAFQQPLQQPPQQVPPLFSQDILNNNIVNDVPEADRRLHVDSKIVEVFSCPGAEMVGRVGTEVILGGDILPEAKKIAHFEMKNRLEQIPPEERAKITDEMIEAEKVKLVEQVFPMVLEQHVKTMLLYCEFASIRQKEEMNMVLKKVGDSFDEKELPQLMKMFEADSRMTLNQKLEQIIGSSIEREKALFVRKLIGHVTLSEIIKEAEGDCTHDEMLNYYNEHKSEFFHKGKVKWEQLSVHISPKMPEAEAQTKIAWMGDQVVLNRVPLATVAEHHSDGPTAKSGGLWNWTSQGSLASEELEKALFQGPVGTYSPILRDRMGFHIIRVLERQEEYYTPYLESQTKIRGQIKEQRRNKKEAELFTELFRKFQPETYQNTVLDSPKKEVKTIFPQLGGTSLHSREMLK